MEMHSQWPTVLTEKLNNKARHDGRHYCTVQGESLLKTAGFPIYQ